MIASNYERAIANRDPAADAFGLTVGRVGGNLDDRWRYGVVSIREVHAVINSKTGFEVAKSAFAPPGAECHGR